MNRRNFLKGIAAAMALPGVVKAGSIMKINPEIIKPQSFTVITSSPYLKIDGVWANGVAYENTTLIVDPNIKGIVVYNRTLHPSEIKAIINYPYQFFNPC